MSLRALSEAIAKVMIALHLTGLTGSQAGAWEPISRGSASSSGIHSRLD